MIYIKWKGISNGTPNRVGHRLGCHPFDTFSFNTKGIDLMHFLCDNVNMYIR